MSTTTLTTTNLLHLQQVADPTDLSTSEHTTRPSTAHPQLKGCVDSPEAATIVLLVVGMAGLTLGTRIFNKLTRTQDMRS